MIRLFVGIKLDKHTRETLAKVKDKADFTKASWIASRNIHLTVKFLGYSPEDSLGKIKNAVRGVTDRYKSFEIKTKTVGAFPIPKRARVLWVGVENGEPLKLIAHDLDDALEPLGFKKEKRPYHPHITLARLRLIQDATETLNINLPSLKMEVIELTLFKSKLSPKGATYSCLENFSLKG